MCFSTAQYGLIFCCSYSSLQRQHSIRNLHQVFPKSTEICKSPWDSF